MPGHVLTHSHGYDSGKTKADGINPVACEFYIPGFMVLIFAEVLTYEPATMKKS
jgi:hypothetical protein